MGWIPSHSFYGYLGWGQGIAHHVKSEDLLLCGLLLSPFPPSASVQTSVSEISSYMVLDLHSAEGVEQH